MARRKVTATVAAAEVNYKELAERYIKAITCKRDAEYVYPDGKASGKFKAGANIAEFTKAVLELEALKAYAKDEEFINAVKNLKAVEAERLAKIAELKAQLAELEK